MEINSKEVEYLVQKISYLFNKVNKKVLNKSSFAREDFEYSTIQEEWEFLNWCFTNEVLRGPDLEVFCECMFLLNNLIGIVYKRVKGFEKRLEPEAKRLSQLLQNHEAIRSTVFGSAFELGKLVCRMKGEK